jgi:hypothetical protein
MVAKTIGSKALMLHGGASAPVPGTLEAVIVYRFTQNIFHVFSAWMDVTNTEIRIF